MNVWMCVELKVLYDTSVPYTCRLYSDFDAVPRRLRLRAPIHLLCQQPLLYVRNMVPLACFQALSKLQEVRPLSLHYANYVTATDSLRNTVHRMNAHLLSFERLQIIGASYYHTLVHNNLFPLAEQLDALHQEYGISYEKTSVSLALSKAATRLKTTAGVGAGGGASDSPRVRLLRSIEEQRRRASGTSGSGSGSSGFGGGIGEGQRAAGGPVRQRAPLEHTNLDFVRLLEERAERDAEAPPDFIHENRVRCLITSLFFFSFATFSLHFSFVLLFALSLSSSVCFLS